MALIKAAKNNSKFNSNYWRVTEVTYLVDENKFNVVLKGYISKEQRDEEGANANSDVFIFYYDTVLKYTKHEVINEVEVPEQIIPSRITPGYVEPAIYDAEGNMIRDEVVYPEITTPEQIIPAHIEKVSTGEFIDVPTNADRFVPVGSAISSITIADVYTLILAKEPMFADALSD